MTDSDDRPKPFLEVRVEDTSGVYPMIGLCAGYELGHWRRKGMGRWLFAHLLEFAFRFSELAKLNSATADAMLREAAKRMYESAEYKARGEFGELLLHAVLRSHFSSHSAASKIFYKSADNDTVKGYDCVHVVDGRDGVELWFGEAKLYKDARQAVRDAIKELAEHAGSGYLRREFALVQGKVEGPFAEDIKRMTDPAVSLDEIFSVLRVPLLITYDSEVVDRHDAVSDDFKQQLVDEIRAEYDYFVTKSEGLPDHLQVHVILVPLKSKEALVQHLEKRLKDLQGSSDDESEDDDVEPNEEAA